MKAAISARAAVGALTGGPRAARRSRRRRPRRGRPRSRRGPRASTSEESGAGGLGLQLALEQPPGEQVEPAVVSGDRVRAGDEVPDPRGDRHRERRLLGKLGQRLRQPDGLVEGGALGIAALVVEGARAWARSRPAAHVAERIGDDAARGVRVDPRGVGCRGVRHGRPPGSGAGRRRRARGAPGTTRCRGPRVRRSTRRRRRARRRSSSRCSTAGRTGAPAAWAAAGRSPASGQGGCGDGARARGGGDRARPEAGGGAPSRARRRTYTRRTGDGRRRAADPPPDRGVGHALGDADHQLAVVGRRPCAGAGPGDPDAAPLHARPDRGVCAVHVRGDLADRGAHPEEVVQAPVLGGRPGAAGHQAASADCRPGAP